MFETVKLNSLFSRSIREYLTNKIKPIDVSFSLILIIIRFIIFKLYPKLFKQEFKIEILPIKIFY